MSDPMRIAVNLRQYFKGKIGGLENYVRNILHSLDSERLTIFVHEEEAQHVREFVPSAEIIKIRHETGLATIAATLKQREFDLFFCPLLVLEPLVVAIPTAVFMPDVQHEFYPEFFDQGVLNWRKENYPLTTSRVDVLFTPSEHTKQTIIEKYGSTAAKIQVVWHDVDDEFRPPYKPVTKEFTALRLPEKYFYFPANYWPHKNHANVLKAFALLVEQGNQDAHLVFTGAPSTGVELVEKSVRELGLQKRVRMLGHVPRDVMPDLYRHAFALLFATKFEGFGIPLLEAFHTGTPVITSNSGSSLEVAGDAAILVDPLDPNSIAEGMRRMVEDEPHRQELIAKGYQRTSLFSWDDAAEITRAAFRKIISPKFKRPVITITEWPKIGIVTPTYNMGHYLEETIQSILTQDYPHLDYVVMDGGSKDQTVEILKKYEGRLRWRSEKDKGQGDAINKGWHNTTGDLFTFLNADDTYLPGALATMARHFRDKPDAGLIYGEAYHVHEDGKIIDRYHTDPFDIATLGQQCYICQPAAFMLREAFSNVGMINAGLQIALDYELWMRIAKLYPIYKVDEYLATSRMYRDNKTLANRRRVYQEILGSVRAHYGYVPFEWINGYACYLIDRKDQFFDRSKPSLASHGLSLILGSYHNPRQLRRYFADWGKSTGFAGSFEGRWDDGWISKRYLKSVLLSATADRIRITGQHVAPRSKGLKLTFKLDGVTVAQTSVQHHGPFEVVIPCGAPLRGKQCQLAIEANRTWSPKANGEFRKLSCRIDAVELLDAGNSR